jgi:hypothetical protein
VIVAKQAIMQQQDIDHHRGSVMAKPTKDQLDMVSAHNSEVGLLCSQWAYLEWLVEIAIWWCSDLLDKSCEDRETATAGKPLSVLARQAGNIAHRKLTSESELAAMKGAAKRIEECIDERNLAVHGVREVMPDETVLARVTRGKYKGALQRLPLVRLKSLNHEVARIIAVIEPLLHSHGVIEGSTGVFRRYES